MSETDILIENYYGRGITIEQLQSFKDKLAVGDVVTLTEPDKMDISVRHRVKYMITAKHKHVFTAQRINKRGQTVTISMAYIKYMVEGHKALARAFPK